MAEIYIASVIAGATENGTTITIPKTGLVLSTATNKFVPAAQNSMESIAAAMTQILADYFTGSRFDAESDRNLIVELSSSGTTTINNQLMVEIIYTYTFRAPAPQAVIDALSLNPSSV